MVFAKKSLWTLIVVLSLVWLGRNCAAQQPGPRGGDGPPRGPEGPGRPGGMHLQLDPPGRWWNNPDIVKRVGVSPDQVKKMDDIFTANRLKLIDGMAAVQKEETIMEPLVAADPPDENKVLSQIDKVAQARAELEKANARMLLELRGQLNHEQWVKLQSERPPMHHGGHFGPGPGEPGPGSAMGGEPGPPPDGPPEPKPQD